MKEFNLSEKIYSYSRTEGEVMDVKDVREFIRRLKDALPPCKWINTQSTLLTIDKLAGDKLNGN